MKVQSGVFTVLYMTIVIAILIIFIWFMPKHMKRRDIYIIWISMSYVELVVDLYLDKVLDLYYFAGSNELNPGVLTIKLFTAPVFAIPFLNFMPNKISRFIPYWLLWAAFATFFEWTTVHFGYLTYTGWKLWYSAVFYTLIFPLVRWHYYYIKHKE